MDILQTVLILQTKSFPVCLLIQNWQKVHLGSWWMSYNNAFTGIDSRILYSQETKDFMFSFVTIAPKILSTDNIKQRVEIKLKLKQARYS